MAPGAARDSAETGASSPVARTRRRRREVAALLVFWVLIAALLGLRVTVDPAAPVTPSLRAEMR